MSVVGENMHRGKLGKRHLGRINSKFREAGMQSRGGTGGDASEKGTQRVSSDFKC